MKINPDSITGDILLDTIQVGVELGKAWHRGIEYANRKVDGWLWNCDWAWANDSRYHRNPR